MVPVTQVHISGDKTQPCLIPLVGVSVKASPACERWYDESVSHAIINEIRPVGICASRKDLSTSSLGKTSKAMRRSKLRVRPPQSVMRRWPSLW